MSLPSSRSMPFRSARSATSPNDYLPKVRAQLSRECGIPPEHVLINASHCHGIVCADVDVRTVQAVKAACQNLVPVDGRLWSRARRPHHGEPPTQA